MALEGTLSDFGLADIFQLIGIQSKTGVLTLKDADARVRVYFQDGRVINADSMSKGNEDRLGTVLVRTGKISQEQLDEVLKTQKETLQQLGHILVSKELLTPEELSESLQMQVTQVIYRLFRWKEGEYHFDQDADVVASAGDFDPLTCESILMEGVRMLDEWPLIESRISSRSLVFKRAHRKARVEMVEDYDAIERDDDTAFRDLIGDHRSEPTIQLTPHEAKVYAKIDGRRTVQDMVESIDLYEFDVCRALYEMAERHLIVEVTPDEYLHPATVAPRRQVSPVLVRALFLVMLAWLAIAVFTMRFNPLNYWAVPATSAMKVGSFKAVQMRLGLERLSVALEAYHVRHGSYPEGLDSLVDDGLVLPEELRPAGAAIAYEPREEGFSLAYSRS